MYVSPALLLLDVTARPDDIAQTYRSFHEQVLRHANDEERLANYLPALTVRRGCHTPSVVRGLFGADLIGVRTELQGLVAVGNLVGPVEPAFSVLLHLLSGEGQTHSLQMAERAGLSITFVTGHDNKFNTVILQRIIKSSSHHSGSLASVRLGALK